jgi:cytochrome oxidase Cu insertion factor (SCO1/SenC/PrrC family)
MLPPRLKRLIITIAIGLSLGAAIAFYEIKNPPNTQVPQPMMATGTASIGGPFKLTNHLGQKVTEKSWPNKYLLIYFGFTYCPDICPTGLQKIFASFDKLPTDTQNKIQPILITLDPARDNATTLKNYVELFSPKLVGLTGTQQQIDAVIKSYRVYAQKAPDINGKIDAKNYMINHSAYIYIITPKGELQGVINSQQSATEIDSELRRLLGA